MVLGAFLVFGRFKPGFSYRHGAGKNKPPSCANGKPVTLVLTDVEGVCSVRDCAALGCVARTHSNSRCWCIGCEPWRLHTWWHRGSTVCAAVMFSCHQPRIQFDYFGSSILSPSQWLSPLSIVRVSNMRVCAMQALLSCGSGTQK